MGWSINQRQLSWQRSNKKRSAELGPEVSTRKTRRALCRAPNEADEQSSDFAGWDVEELVRSHQSRRLLLESACGPCGNLNERCDPGQQPRRDHCHAVK